MNHKPESILILILTALFLTDQCAYSSIVEPTTKKSFILSDHLGSTISVVNESGIEESHTEYKSFGSIKEETGKSTLKRKFTGKELDDSTGLYDYEARQYDANIGRFITADPLAWNETSLKQVDGKRLQEFLSDPQNLNRYSYGLNNPLVYKDPSGLKVEWAQYYVYITVKIFGVTFKKNTNKLHNYWILTPDNPADFSGNGRFYRNSEGKLEATITGKPQREKLGDYGNLISVPNGDRYETSVNKILIPTPIGMTDTQHINGFVETDSNYKGNLPYDPLPDSKKGKFNSNSLFTSVGKANKVTQFRNLPASVAKKSPGITKSIPLSRRRR